MTYRSLPFLLQAVLICHCMVLNFSTRIKESVVPNIVHQIYDYQSPNLFMFMSIMCVQRYMKPDRHIIWVNDEGKYRKMEWKNWQLKAKPKTWEAQFADLIKLQNIEVKFVTFPATPPGNDSIYVVNRAHKSDFLRMDFLSNMGGIYLDTDVFPLRDLDPLRGFNFALGFDNIVNSDEKAFKKVNNGVLLSSPNSTFLRLWTER